MQPKSDTSGSGHASLLPLINTSTSHNTEELKDAVRRWKSRKTTSSPTQKTQQTIRSAASPHSPSADVKVSAIALAVDNAVSKQAVDPPYNAASAKDFAGPLTFETIMRMKKKSRTDTKPPKSAPTSAPAYPKNPLTSGGPTPVNLKTDEASVEPVMQSGDTSTPLFPPSVPTVNEAHSSVNIKDSEDPRLPVAEVQSEAEKAAIRTNDGVGGVGSSENEGGSIAQPLPTQSHMDDNVEGPAAGGIKGEGPSNSSDADRVDEPSVSAPSPTLETETEAPLDKSQQHAGTVQGEVGSPAPEPQLPTPPVSSTSPQPPVDIAESQTQVVIAVAPPASATTAQSATVTSATSAVAVATTFNAKKVKKPSGTPNNESYEVAGSESAPVAPAPSVKTVTNHDAGAARGPSDASHRVVAAPPTAAALKNPLREQPPQPPSAFRAAQVKKFVGESVPLAKYKNATTKVGGPRAAKSKLDEGGVKTSKLPPRPLKGVSERSASAPQPANPAATQRLIEAPSVVPDPPVGGARAAVAPPAAPAATAIPSAEQPIAAVSPIFAAPLNAAAPTSVVAAPIGPSPAAVLRVRRRSPHSGGEQAQPATPDIAMEDGGRPAASDDKMEERSPHMIGGDGSRTRLSCEVDEGGSANRRQKAATERISRVADCQSFNVPMAYRYSNDHHMSVRAVPPEMLDPAHLHMLPHPAYVMPVYARPPEPACAPETAPGPSAEEALRLRQEASAAWQRRIEQVTYDSVEVLVRDLEKICAGELARLPSDEQTTVLEHRDRLLKNLLGTIRI